MKQVVTIRSIKQAIAEIKKTDPNTKLTEGWLRARCKENPSFCIRLSGGYGICMELLYDYINAMFGLPAA